MDTNEGKSCAANGERNTDSTFVPKSISYTGCHMINMNAFECLLLMSHTEKGKRTSNDRQEGNVYKNGYMRGHERI